MSDTTAATADDAPSPWWPCPECGSVHFRATMSFERGSWMPDGRYVLFDPPTGTPTGIDVSHVDCLECGNEFDIAHHYGWQP